MTLWQVIRREKRQCACDPRRFLFIFGAAIVYLLIFSVLFAPDIIRAVPTVLCDEDQSPLSRDLLQRFEHNERMHVTSWVSSQEEMQVMLREKKALLALCIPRDLSRSINNGGYSTILCIANASNIMPVSAVTADAETIAENFNNEIAVKRAELVTGQIGSRVLSRVRPVRTELRVMHNPLQSFTLFYLIGLLAAALQQGVFFATGASVFQEEERRDGERGEKQAEAVPTAALQGERVSGQIPFWKLTAGKVIWYSALGLLSYLVIIALLVWVLGMRLKAGIAATVLAGGVYMVSVASLGLCFASFFRTELRFVQFSIAYPLAGFILSGFTWPLSAMPPFVRALANLLPQTWFANLLRELFLAGYSPLYGKALVAMACIGAACFGLCLIVYNFQHKTRNPFCDFLP